MLLGRPSFILASNLSRQLSSCLQILFFYFLPELNHESSNTAQVGHSKAHSVPFIVP